MATSKLLLCQTRNPKSVPLLSNAFVAVHSVMSNSLRPHRTRLPVLHYLLEFAHIHVHWVIDAIQPSHPLSPPSPPALNLLQHRVFCNESAHRIRWSKYWSSSFNISPSNEYSGFIFFRIDWFGLLAVWGTLKHFLYNSSYLQKWLILIFTSYSSRCNDRT